MRDLFLFGRLYRFTFSGAVVIFYFLDGPVASLFKIWVTFRQKSRLLTLSDHAARKSGNARRKPGTGFSDAISGALGRPAAQSSGVKKTLSSVFFTLPKHAAALQCIGIVNEKFAFQSLSYKDFEIGDFTDGFPEVWAVPRHKPLE